MCRGKRKTMVYTGSRTIRGFRHPRGELDRITHGKGRGYNPLCPDTSLESQGNSAGLYFYDPMDYRTPGSSVHGVFQARIWSGLPFPSPEEILLVSLISSRLERSLGMRDK